MSQPCLELDVLVQGAGPAGRVAALRLQQLGYRVAVLERQHLPRAHVGEALTPGIHNVLSLLDAASALAAVPSWPDLPTRLCWSDPEPMPLAAPKAGHLLIDRGAFDQALLALFCARGGHGFAPGGLLDVAGEPGAWRVAVRCEAHGLISARARVMLDARGRVATPEARRLATAPPLLAAWGETAMSGHAAETLVEALPGGWLWGSPLPSGLYRVMHLSDPSLRGAQDRARPAERLRLALSCSRLFQRFASAGFQAGMHVCAATPYVDTEPWLPGRLKTGDAAFAVDPLSSSGVEKAMRCSLHAATAIHTLLRKPDEQALAERFYRSRLCEGVAMHGMWTQRHYRQAWPGAQHAFWRARGGDFDLGPGAWGRAIANEWTRLSGAGSALRHEAATEAGPGHEGRFTVSSRLSYVDEMCVVDDLVQLKTAVMHPHLDRPVAFLEGQELVPLLEIASCVGSLATVIELWSYGMPVQTARRIALWMIDKGLLITPEQHSRTRSIAMADVPSAAIGML